MFEMIRSKDWPGAFIVLLVMPTSLMRKIGGSLETALGESESTRLVWKPTTTTAMDLEGMQKLMKLIEALEDDDDVQRVTTNFEASDEVMAQL